MNVITSYTSSLRILHSLRLWVFSLVKQSPHMVTKGRVLAPFALYHFKKDYFVECLPQNYLYQNSSFLHTQVDFALVFTVSNPNTIPIRITLLKDRQKKLWGAKGTTTSSYFGNISHKMPTADLHFWCLLLSLSSK